MLRAAFALALGFIVATGTAGAEDKKPEVKKLEGTLTCTKCALKETKACGNALIVKKDGKDVKYYLVDKAGKATLPQRMLHCRREGHRDRQGHREGRQEDDRRPEG